MKRKWAWSMATVLAATLIGAGGGAGEAQLLPAMPALPGLPGIGRGLSDLPDPGAAIASVGRISRQAVERLDTVRRETFARLVRDHPDAITFDPQGFPARAGEVVVDAPSDALLGAAVKAGYTLIERDEVLGVGFARLRVPEGRSLKAALSEITRLGGGEVSADQLHLPSGVVSGGAPVPAADSGGRGPWVGVIDGGVDGAAVVQGFATGAPRANDHGTAVASLITGGNGVRGALPGARIASADVYGSDPAGGNATAIAKALGGMVRQRVPVATISLVGPANPLLARVVAAAQARGLIIVAAVGNGGPMQPLSYPASYPGVVAVTAVDAWDRVLIEAGRASHVDYAAPGADMMAVGVGGRRIKVRGTSFAAPLVAARIAAVYPAPEPGQIRPALARVDASARDLGRRGEDKIFGRGVVCAECRTPAQ
ncbi:S8 family serine peptidase [Sphingomonas sp.]|uniref:S8 family serine peptidase n=1 Tax=Sphingomonas sp. TaxID=28214 RepID=UPI0031DE10CA